MTTERDPNLIYPGDPRHPCPICGGRSRGYAHTFMFSCPFRPSLCTN